jgi:ABC-2 type transport system ATP-binding protein
VVHHCVVLLYKLFKWLRSRLASRRAASAGRASAPAVLEGRRLVAVGDRRTVPIDPDVVISVRGLHKSYGGFEAVRGVDLDVRLGEVFAFLGPNGAGKTTTVEILEGYRSRSAGELQVLGVDPAAAPRSWRNRLGVVLQDSQPESYLTVRQCLELYAGYFRRPRPIAETLELVGLADKMEAVTTELSGGQRRRLDVALALIGDPELIFLDEPTTGFDPSARRAAWEVIAGLRSLGKTIFLTTHYMDEAERLADRIAVIADGVIVAEGTPWTLGGRDRAASIISFSLPEGHSRETLPSEFLQLSQIEGDGRVTIRSEQPMPALQALASWALERRLDLADIDVHRPTLEDIYLSLIGEPS